MRKTIEELLKEYSGISLDIGCGENKQEGFVGMDIRYLPTVDIVHDCEEFPWPLPDNCVNTAIAIHIVEHINPHKFGMIKFMDEVWRIMKPNGQFVIITPHGMSPGYLQDPTHCNPCNEMTFAYFDPLEFKSGGMLYKIYKPKPWRLENLFWHPAGNIEVKMRKRIEDKSYYD